MCSDNEGEIVDLAGPSNAAAELDAAQVAHDLDELIMEDDESVEEETPLEGKWNVISFTMQCSLTKININEIRVESFHYNFLLCVFIYF